MTELARSLGLAKMRAYIAEIQPLMRLDQWQISVEDARPESEDYIASVNRYASSWHAHVRFGDNHFTASLKEQRLTVAHELIHLHLMNLDSAFNDTIEFLDPTSKLWGQDRRRHELEMATDAISRMIAPFLPLPPE